MEGKSKHFVFIEFESAEVAKIVRVYVIPPEQVHPKIGFNYRHKPLDSVQIELKQHDKERTLEDYKKLVEKIMKHDKKRRKRIEAADIDYEWPQIVVGDIQPTPKKIKFED
uniref:MKI67 FHA domain-interacting nucleolar phosphoprotein n=1 Tax=Cajanus cajan TaxID=3821 RepID=A0A151TP25_CAJCA|nr:MKI67 FHA domain-interacting nucleolar phosphoprotein [Cajanus cajan]